MDHPALVSLTFDDGLRCQFEQAAPSHIYARQGLIGVADRFEYVTYNGARVSRADAEEEMRRLEIID